VGWFVWQLAADVIVWTTVESAFGADENTFFFRGRPGGDVIVWTTVESAFGADEKISSPSGEAGWGRCCAFDSASSLASCLQIFF
jgi:hypothetical protein